MTKVVKPKFSVGDVVDYVRHSGTATGRVKRFRSFKGYGGAIVFEYFVTFTTGHPAGNWIQEQAITGLAN